MVRSRRYLLLVLALTALGLTALPVTASAQDDLNCSDFSSQQDAQATYVEQDGDPDNLDDDSDGSACEDFDYEVDLEFTDASNDAYVRDTAPIRGVASGGGSTAQNATSPLPLLVSGGVFGLLALGTWGLSLRRRLGR